MKHAVLLLWHNDILQLKELLSLFNSNFEFYIHLDKKCKLPEKELEKLSNLTRVKGIYSRYSVHCGGFNVLKAELFLLSEILTDKTVDYIHFLSGQDYIAKPSVDMDAFFADHNGSEFIEWQSLADIRWEGGSYDRYDYFRFFDYFNYCSSSGKKIIDKIVNFQRAIGYKRNIPHPYSKLYVGSNGMSITRKCGEYILSSQRKNRPFYNRLKHTWAPEETYFPTIILNSPFAGRVINNNLRYIVRNRENKCSSILDETDLGDILLSNCLFIRKVDRNISGGLLARIRKYILGDPLVNIDQRGYWTNDTLAGHSFDLSLGKAIINLFRYANVGTIADLGCGPGWYVAFLRKHDFDIQGYDGNPNTPFISSLFFNDGFHCQCADLTKEFNTPKPFDTILCLEVGEHIPAEYEEILFHNLTNNAKQYVLLSWAVKGQPGDGHINYKSNEYVISRMAKSGFTINTPAGNYLRNQATLWWFKKTLMFFERTSLAPISIPDRKNLDITIEMNQQEKDNLLMYIARYLILNIRFITTPGLYDGKMGVTLFFFHYARYCGSGYYNQLAEELLDEILNELTNKHPIIFESGLSGIGWSIEYLIKNKFVEGNSDEILSDFDRIILKESRSNMRDTSVGTGVKGIYYYAMARRKAERRNKDILPFDTEFPGLSGDKVNEFGLPPDGKTLLLDIAGESNTSDITKIKPGLADGWAGYGLKIMFS